MSEAVVVLVLRESVGGLPSLDCSSASWTAMAARVIITISQAK